jgi:hypothetical protein
MANEKKDAHLEKAAEHAREVADLADRASNEAHDVADEVQAAVDNNRSAFSTDESGPAEAPTNTGGGSSSPDSYLPGESSVTRPDY